VIVASFVLLGGSVVAINLITTGHPFGVGPAFQAETGYGAWKNLWAFPYLLLTVPFSPSPIQVYVPWRHQWWWWMGYEMHTSHFGVLFTPIALALVPAVILDLRRPSSSERLQRFVTMGASVAAAVAMVPMRLSPSQEGGFNCFPRYLLYVVPAVIAFVVPPGLEWLARRARGALWQNGAVLGASIFFVVSGVVYAINDIYEPAQWAWTIFFNAGDRLPTPLQSSDKIAFALDALAGPREEVLFDAGFDAWTYPAFGADWSRPVTFAPDGLQPLEIPDSVKWVAVDRAFRVTWGDPEFKTMGDAIRHFFRGQPSAEDLRTIRQLDADPRFRLVFRSFRSNQALYQRRPPGQRPEDDPRPFVVPALK
jgi:hypothetical protein